MLVISIRFIRSRKNPSRNVPFLSVSVEDCPEETIRKFAEIFKEKIEIHFDIWFRYFLTKKTNRSFCLNQIGTLISFHVVSLNFQRKRFWKNLNPKCRFQNSFPRNLFHILSNSLLFDRRQTQRHISQCVKASRCNLTQRKRGRGHASPDHPRDRHYLRLLAKKFPEVGWNARETKTGGEAEARKRLE